CARQTLDYGNYGGNSLDVW
nr:immunoglobulin heavy chain junction region [Macaca mulatta]MOW90791.1 immunoglobulin heavy chain junction region [Macaca mulatta]MOW91059.1 immunoglobulin heavy chain junction region [Macaca mulatta]MOW92005.1 immunoglobulin heavy chain junction region [Macaca mulatta]MOW95457.1 immunoglobulin heavy chain junction region [Macaca mulatta]